MDHILIQGARVHNLKNITVRIPRNALVVITGVSGSGKSSLAFDTLYAEGQRRYVESLSAYARQFLERMDKPDVDLIDGLSPAISIEQKTASHNPRSTVGTTTEIYDYLRLLFATIGKPLCPNCHIPIQSLTVDQMVESLLAYPMGTKMLLLAPLVEGRKGEYRQLFIQMLKEGFIRARVDGEMVSVEAPPALEKNKTHTIEAVVDRLVLKEKIRARLAESLTVALRVGKGLAKVVFPDREETFSEKNACIRCGFSYAEISPRFFSFNSPYGACPQCHGLGTVRQVDVDRLLPDPALSLEDGAIVLWGPGSFNRRLHRYLRFLRRHGIPPYTPWKDIPKNLQEAILHGKGSMEGVIPMLLRLSREAQSFRLRREIEPFIIQTTCPACQGKRLRREALSILIEGYSISDLADLSVQKALQFLDNLSLSPKDQAIAGGIVKEIRQRLTFLCNVGLSYLTLARASNTLSGGESQRIRLATQIGTRLTGVIYVLDEPSIGLHPRDNQRLLETLKELKNLGNTVVVVEHDEGTIRQADHVVDLGPGAGKQGGDVVFSGTPKDLLQHPASLTAQYLSGKKQIPLPQKRRSTKGQKLIIRGARHHNLKNIDVPIPLHTLTVVTGVSGSGKSSLIEDVLHKGLRRYLYKAAVIPGEHDAIEGISAIDKVIDVDQSPIGRTPRSNPATYTGCFTPIRELFSQLPEARMRGYKPGIFSFNVPGGRCEACQGAGVLKIEMHFLPDIFVTCDACKGKRFLEQTLQVTYKGYSIADVLAMTVDEAYELFHTIPRIARILDTLQRVGLGYLPLGQPATTLSGGEAQRIKLARELCQKPKGHTLYLLDEPTVGLHNDDVKKLLLVLQALVERGNTVVIIEHHLDVIKSADWVIDLGPEGGDEGGYLVAAGTPEAIAQCPNSYTGKFLQKILSKTKEVA